MKPSYVFILADATNWRAGVPGLTTKLRGLVDCVVEVRTLDHAVHSGMYGASSAMIFCAAL